MDAKSDEFKLWHQSGVNQRGEPFVQLTLGKKVIGQMTPEEARDHARALTEAAEAAEQDAFLLYFFTEEVGATQEDATRMLIGFRQWREKRSKRGGPSRPDDWVMPETQT